MSRFEGCFLLIGSLFRVSYTVLWVYISNLMAATNALYKIKGLPVWGPTVSQRVWLVRLGEYFHLVSHHESTVEADTKLSNDRTRLLRSPLALQLVHERLTITTHWQWSYHNNESSVKRIWCMSTGPWWYYRNTRYLFQPNQLKFGP